MADIKTRATAKKVSRGGANTLSLNKPSTDDNGSVVLPKAESVSQVRADFNSFVNDELKKKYAAQSDRYSTEIHDAVRRNGITTIVPRGSITTTEGLRAGADAAKRTIDRARFSDPIAYTSQWAIDKLARGLQNLPSVNDPLGTSAIARQAQDAGIASPVKDRSVSSFLTNAINRSGELNNYNAITAANYRLHDYESQLKARESGDLAQKASLSGNFSSGSRYNANLYNDKDYDLVYEQINNSRRYQNWLNSTDGANGWVPNGNGGSYLEYRPEYSRLTEEEKSVYNYYYNQGDKEAANAYLEGIRSDLQRRRAETNVANYQAYGAEHPIAGTAGAVAMSPIGGLGAIPAAAEALFTGKVNPYASYNQIIEMRQGLKGGAKETIVDDITKIYGKSAGEAAGFLYDAGTSWIESMTRAVTNAAIPGLGFAGLLSMSLEAGQAGMNEYAQNGASGSEALALGVINGLAEYITENMQMERITGFIKSGTPEAKKTIVTWFRDLVLNSIKESIPEAAEEAVSAMVDKTAEMMILGVDRSAWGKRVEELVNGENPMSREDAEKQATLEQWKEIGLEAAAGAVSGALGAQFGTNINYGISASIKGAESAMNRSADRIQRRADREAAKISGEVKNTSAMSAEQWEASRKDQSAEAVRRRQTIRDTGERHGVGENTIRELQAASDRTGRNVAFTILPYSESASMNGVFDDDGNVLVNAKSNKPLHWILLHEFGHSIENSKEFNSLARLAVRHMYENGIDVEREIQKRAILYAKNGATNANPAYEMIMDWFGSNMGDSVKDIERLCNYDHGLGIRAWNYINEQLSRALGSGDQHQAAILNRAKEMYGRALSETAPSARRAWNTTEEPEYVAPAAEETEQKTAPKERTPEEIDEEYENNIGDIITEYAARRMTDEQYQSAIDELEQKYGYKAEFAGDLAKAKRKDDAYQKEVDKAIDDYNENKIDQEGFNKAIDQLEEKYGYKATELRPRKVAETEQTPAAQETPVKAEAPAEQAPAAKAETKTEEKAPAKRQITPQAGPPTAEMKMAKSSEPESYRQERASLGEQLRNGEIDAEEYGDRTDRLDDEYGRDVVADAEDAAAAYNVDENGEREYSYSTDLDRLYPGWNDNSTTSSGRDNTQIAGTISTYRRIGQYLEQTDPDARILDASSGLGLGTQDLKARGFDIDDVEPFPSDDRRNNANGAVAPTYTDYADIPEGSYDVVISNAVLNVVPDDWRNDVVDKMAKAVAPGGKLIVNVRDAAEVAKTPSRIPLENDSEILVTQNGKPRHYQKGFTQSELENYLRDRLGDGWTVEKAKPSNSGLPSGSRAVVAVKDKDTGTAHEDGIDISNDTKSAYKYSYTTWNKSDYVQKRDEAAEELAENVLGEATDENIAIAKKWIDDVNGIASVIANDRTRLDYVASPGRSSFKSNAEYGGSIDSSTICAKRRLLTGTIDAIQTALGDEVLSEEDYLAIRDMMKREGHEVSCGLCYVESTRKNIAKYASQFLKEWNAEHPDNILHMTDVNTVFGLEDTRLNNSEAYDAYVSFMNKLAQRKLKLFEMRAEYDNDILKKFRNDDSVEAKNHNGGLRINSFSDFEIVHLIDMMQVITDMANVGLNGQAYTKVREFAEALGGTGLKINMSMICGGVDENGRIIFDEVEGMKWSDVEDLRDKYPDNVGTILVTFTDEQLKAALNDDRIDFIIPFHRSQWSKKDYALLGIPANAKDATPQQNERYIEPVYRINKNGKPVKMRPDNYMPNNYWRFDLSGKENAENYLRMCAENNRRPKFYKLLVNNGDGSYSLQPDGSTDGYWKLLIDFKMYNHLTGEGAEQKPVRPIFDMDACQRMLNNYKGGHQSFPVAQDIVDSFVNEYKGRGKAKYNNGKYTLEGGKFSYTSNVTPEEETEVKDYVDSLPAKTKFSISTPVEKVETGDGRYLIAVHNVDTANLYKMLTKWGKIPSPSIAVMVNGMTHDDYGEDTIVFKKEAVDPQAHKGNRIYGGDAFTRTTSMVEDIDSKSAEEVAAEIGNEQTGDLEEFNSVEDARNSLLDPTEQSRQYNWEAKRADKSAYERLRQITSALFDEWYSKNVRNNPRASREFENADYDDLDDLFDWIDDVTRKIASEDWDSADINDLVEDRLGSSDISNIERSFIENYKDKIANGMTFIAASRTRQNSAKGKIDELAPYIDIRRYNDAQQLFNASANYYEAKSGRAIGADEIAGVVLSEDSVKSEPKLTDVLNDMGIPYEIYDGNDSRKRMDAVNRITKSVPDAKFSVTPAENAEYMKAAEAGDEETAGEMVADAARRAGAFTDEGGEPLKLYHGTDYYEPIEIFKAGKNGYLGPGIYMTPDEKFAKKYADKSGGNGTVYAMYGFIKKPLYVSSAVPAQEILREIYGSDRIYNNRSAKNSWSTQILTKADMKKLRDKGYDGIVWKYGNSPTEVMVFDSNQTKSANPIERDNNGNIIHLNERFNPEENRYKYSYTENESQSEQDTKLRPMTAVEQADRRLRNAQFNARVSERQAAADNIRLTAAERREMFGSPNSVGKVNTYATAKVAEAEGRGKQIIANSRDVGRAYENVGRAKGAEHEREGRENKLKLERAGRENKKQLEKEGRAEKRRIIKEGAPALDQMAKQKYAKAKERGYAAGYESGTKKANREYTQLVKQYEREMIEAEDKENAHVQLWEKARNQEYKPIESAADAVDMYNALKAARRAYRRISDYNELTPRERMFVGRLLRDEEDAATLFREKDIRYLKVLSEATAVYNYSKLGSMLGEYRGKIHTEANKTALDAIGGSENFRKMRDVPQKLLASAMTTGRVFDYIAGNDYEMAERLKDAYVKPITRSNGAEERLKQRVKDRISALNIDKSIRKGNKVSEDYAVQFIGEKMSEIEALEDKESKWRKQHDSTISDIRSQLDGGVQKNGRPLTEKMRQNLEERLNNHESKEMPEYKNEAGQTLEELRAEVEAFKNANRNLDYNRIENDLVPVFREIYNDLFEKMNEARVANGYEPVDYRRGYFPHFTREDTSAMVRFAKSLGMEFDNKVLPTSIQGLTHEFRPGINWFSAAQERTGTNTDFSAQEGMDRYLEGVAKVIYRTENITKMRALANTIRRLADPKFDRFIKDVYSDKTKSEEEKYAAVEQKWRNELSDDKKAQRQALSYFVTWLDERTNIYAGKATNFDRLLRENLQVRTDKGLWKLLGFATDLPRGMVTRYGGNTVSINPGSWLTNFAPIFEVSAEVNPKYVLQALGSLKKDLREGFTEESNFLTARSGTDPLFTIADIGKTQMNHQGALKWLEGLGNVMKGAVNWGAKPMELIDGVTSYVVTRAYYLSNLDKGMSHDAALDLADNQAGDLMADRAPGKLPILMEIKNPIAKGFTQFQTEVLNSLEHNTHDVFGEIRKRYADDPKRGRAVIKSILRYMGFALRKSILLWLCNELYEALVGRRFMPDPIDWANEFIGDLTGYQLPNTVNLGINAGLAAVSGGKVGRLPTAEDFMVKAEPGKAVANLGKNVAEEFPIVGSMLGGGRIPVQQAFKDVSKLPKGIALLTDDDKENDESGWANLIKGLSGPLTYFVLPGGGTAVRRAVQAAEQYVQGGAFDVNGNLRYPLYNDNTLELVTNVAKVGLFGSTSSEAGQKWVDSGFDSFSKDATAAYIALTELGIDRRKAYGVVNKMRDVTKSEDESENTRRRAFIREQDIDGRAKAALYETMVLPDTAKARDVIDTLDIMGADMDKAMDLILGLADIDAKGYTVPDDSSKAAEKRKLLNSSRLDGDSKLEVYSNLILTSNAAKERDLISRVKEFCDDGELVKVLTGLKESSKTLDQSRVLVESSLPDDVKEEVYKTMCVNADQVEKKESQIDAFREAGMGFNEYITAANKYAEINAQEDLKPVQKATEFARWADTTLGSGSSAAKENLKYSSGFSVEASGYEKMTDTGLSSDKAYDLNNQIAALTPKEGKTSVSDVQKAQVVASQADLSEEEKLKALRAVYSDSENSTYSKAYVANMYGVPLDTYFKIVDKCLEVDADPKYKDYKAQERTAAVLNSFKSLSNKQRAAIWQVYNTGWVAKNNPYDSSVGAYVRSLYYEADGKTKKETLPGGLSRSGSSSASAELTPPKATVPSGTSSSGSGQKVAYTPKLGVPRG